MIPSTFIKKTKRLEIRFYRPSDYELWKQTKENTPKPRNRWDVNPDPNFKATKSNFLKTLREEKIQRKAERYFFIAIDKKSKKIVGHAIVYDIRRSIFQSGGVGYGIYNHSWGQGYGRELVLAVLDIGFTKLKLHRIEAAIEKGNRRSIGLAKSVGMVREGLRRGFVFFENQWKDLLIFSMLSEDRGIVYPSLKKKP